MLNTHNHPNLTLRKFASFCVMSVIGAGVLVAIQYPLVEWFGIHYIPATLLAGGIALLAKFIISGVFVYRR